MDEQWTNNAVSGGWYSDLNASLFAFVARMNEVLEELSWDVQQWLLVLPNTRVPEARNLLREVRRWVLLSTCDHDGVIACYRTLKGLLDLWPAGSSDARPALSLTRCN